MLRLSRYTDTDLDPYGAHHGLFWTHIGWMLVKPSVKPGYADVRDLNRNEVVQWQHRWYFPLALVAGLILPWATSGYLWGDWRGGFYYVCFFRLLCVHHVSKLLVYSTSPWPLFCKYLSLWRFPVHFLRQFNRALLGRDDIR